MYLRLPPYYCYTYMYARRCTATKRQENYACFNAFKYFTHSNTSHWTERFAVSLTCFEKQKRHYNNCTGKEYTMKPKQNKLKANHAYLKTILVNVERFHVSCCCVIAHAQPYTVAERALTASTLKNYM